MNFIEWLAELGNLLIEGASGPWALVIVFLLAMIDGFFPVVPSESVVIAVATLSVTGAGPAIWALILVAAAGAFLGDQIAFTVGQLIPTHRIPFLNRGKGAQLVEKANALILQRPASLLIGGRFVPGGRVAVNVAAGAMGFPRRRFVVIDVVAVLLWASYSTLLGLAAGAYLNDHPLIAAVVGVTLGILMGLVVDRGIAAWHAWREKNAGAASAT